VEITGVPKSATARVTQKQEKMRDEWTLRYWQQGVRKKRKREGKNPDVEEVIPVVTGRDVRVSGPMLKNKSEELAKHPGHNHFKATDWLVVSMEMQVWGKIQEGTCREGQCWCCKCWTVEIHKGARLGYGSCAQMICAVPMEQVYFIVAHRTDPWVTNTQLWFREINFLYVRITVLCCSNMLGTDKRKLLVIGKRSKTRCFKGISI
jgi:hypothetical protein